MNAQEGGAHSPVRSRSSWSYTHWNKARCPAKSGASPCPRSGASPHRAHWSPWPLSSSTPCAGCKRFYPPDREVLKGINLSFYPGAKIGVIGSNGSGKSSLLRIMAGDDDGFTGEARLTPGFTVGFLPQEPQLDPTKDVAGNVAEGVGEAKRSRPLQRGLRGDGRPRR